MRSSTSGVGLVAAGPGTVWLSSRVRLAPTSSDARRIRSEAAATSPDDARAAQRDDDEPDSHRGADGPEPKSVAAGHGDLMAAEALVGRENDRQPCQKAEHDREQLGRSRRRSRRGLSECRPRLSPSRGSRGQCRRVRRSRECTRAASERGLGTGRCQGRIGRRAGRSDRTAREPALARTARRAACQPHGGRGAWPAPPRPEGDRPSRRTRATRRYRRLTIRREQALEHGGWRQRVSRRDVVPEPARPGSIGPGARVSAVAEVPTGRPATRPATPKARARVPSQVGRSRLDFSERQASSSLPSATQPTNSASTQPER